MTPTKKKVPLRNTQNALSKLTLSFLPNKIDKY